MNALAAQQLAAPCRARASARARAVAPALAAAPLRASQSIASVSAFRTMAARQPRVRASAAFAEMDETGVIDLPSNFSFFKASS